MPMQAGQLVPRSFALPRRGCVCRERRIRDKEKMICLGRVAIVTSVIAKG